MANNFKCLFIKDTKDIGQNSHSGDIFLQKDGWSSAENKVQHVTYKHIYSFEMFDKMRTITVNGSEYKS